MSHSSLSSCSSIQTPRALAAAVNHSPRSSPAQQLHSQLSRDGLRSSPPAASPQGRPVGAAITCTCQHLLQQQHSRAWHRAPMGCPPCRTIQQSAASAAAAPRVSGGASCSNSISLSFQGYCRILITTLNVLRLRSRICSVALGLLGTQSIRPIFRLASWAVDDSQHQLPQVNVWGANVWSVVVVMAVCVLQPAVLCVLRTIHNRAAWPVYLSVLAE